MTTAAEVLKIGTEMKEAGNTALKEQKLDIALQKYEEGLEALRALSAGEHDAQAIELKKSLYSNMSLVTMKLERWSDCIQAANAVLEMDSDNVKALLRRGSAHVKAGADDLGRADFNKVLGLDANNVDAKRELLALNKKAAPKKTFGSGMFSKAGGLYDDREKQMEAKRKQEEAERHVRRTTWEAEISRRKAAGAADADETFEEWEEKRKAAEEQARKAKIEETQKKITPYGVKDDDAPPPPQQASGSSGSTAAPAPKPKAAAKPKVNDDDLLDEEDLKILNETKKLGYCYFNKRYEMTEEQKATLEEQLKPIRFDQDVEAVKDDHYRATIVESAQKMKQAATETGAKISTWNTAGTSFEEKDSSAAFKGALLSAFAKDGEVNLVDASCGGEDAIFTDADSYFATPAAAKALGGPVNPAEVGMLSAAFAGVSVASVGTPEAKDCDASIAMFRGALRLLFTVENFSVTLKLTAPSLPCPLKANVVIGELSSTKPAGEYLDWTAQSKLRWLDGCEAELKDGGLLKMAEGVLRVTINRVLDAAIARFKTDYKVQL